MPLNVIKSTIPKLMRRFVQEASYYQSRLCSCVHDNNGSFDPLDNCVQGFYYYTPETTYLIRTSMKNNLLNTPSGRVVNIDAVFTIPKFYKGVEQTAWTNIAHGDIITLSNKSRRDTDVLVKGVRDFIYAFDVDKVLSIYTKSNKYVEGTDFKVTVNPMEFEDNKDIDFEDDEPMNPDESRLVPGNISSIEWLGTSNQPSEKEAYTVEFICREQYRIWDDGSMNRGTTEDDLPKRVRAVIRRFVNPERNVIDTINVQQGVF